MKKNKYRIHSRKENLEINRELLTNYSFIDSKENAMIQVSDYVVSIIKKLHNVS